MICVVDICHMTNFHFSGIACLAGLNKYLRGAGGEKRPLYLQPSVSSLLSNFTLAT